MKFFLILTTVVFMFSGAIFAEDRAPARVVYEDFIYRIKSGEITTFEQMSAFYASRKISAVEEQIPVYMAQMKLSRDEVFEKLTQVNIDTDKCLDLNLLSETDEAGMVKLVYSASDICNQYAGQRITRQVLMANEGGDWKIAEDITNLH